MAMRWIVNASLVALMLTLGGSGVVAVSAQPMPAPKTTISDSALDAAKVKCRELGFKAGTEKFGSCVLTLYEKPVAEPAEKPSPAASPAPVPDTPLRPIMSTRTLPPYPPSAWARNETGTTVMEVHITTEGNVDDCKLVTSSGSETLDTAACAHVKQTWLWYPPTHDGKPVAVSTRVAMNFSSHDASDTDGVIEVIKMINAQNRSRAPAPHQSQVSASPKAAFSPPLTDCDTYAANPSDPGHLGRGVMPLGKIETSKAIKACVLQLRFHPSTARFQYQLGRSLVAQRQYNLAIQAFRLAAEQNYAAALNDIGYLYASGNGVPKDYNRALKWFSFSAAQNYAPAQSAIGDLYYSGFGVPKDYDQAMRWYQKAAAQGDAHAISRLAGLNAASSSASSQSSSSLLDNLPTPNLGEILLLLQLLK